MFILSALMGGMSLGASVGSAAAALTGNSVTAGAAAGAGTGIRAFMKEIRGTASSMQSPDSCLIFG